MYGERYRIHNTNEILTPALIYYKDIIEDNIQKMIRTAGGAKRLWPHVKSHKMQAMVELQISKGITKFKAATIAEAEMAAEAGASDVLLAYPLVGPNIPRFLKLEKKYRETCFWATGDNIKQLDILGSLAKQQHIKVNFLVDVNTGTNRTGVGIDKLEEFYKNAAKISGLRPRGLHCYDGNHGIADYNARKAAVDQSDRSVFQVMDKLKSEGYDCSVLVMGGTPTFPCHAQYENVYLSPGTSMIYDFGYSELYRDEPFIPAGILLTRVVSLAAPGYFTIDLGYKGIAADPPGQRGKLLNVSHAEPVEQNEEHWIWKMKAGYEEKRPSIGRVLYVMPTHICPTTALYGEVLLAEKGKVTGKWEVTARNRKLTI